MAFVTNKPVSLFWQLLSVTFWRLRITYSEQSFLLCYTLQILDWMLFKIVNQTRVKFHCLFIREVQSVNQHIEVFNESSVRGNFGLVFNASDGVLDQPFLQSLIIGAFKHEREAEWGQNITTWLWGRPTRQEPEFFTNGSMHLFRACYRSQWSTREKSTVCLCLHFNKFGTFSALDFRDKGGQNGAIIIELVFTRLIELLD